MEGQASSGALATEKAVKAPSIEGGKAALVDGKTLPTSYNQKNGGSQLTATWVQPTQGNATSTCSQLTATWVQPAQGTETSTCSQLTPWYSRIKVLLPEHIVN